MRAGRVKIQITTCCLLAFQSQHCNVSAVSWDPTAQQIQILPGQNASFTWSITLADYYYEGVGQCNYNMTVNYQVRGSDAVLAMVDWQSLSRPDVKSSSPSLTYMADT